MLRNIFHTLTALLLITLFTAIEAKAQRHYVPHVHVGGHAGVTLSQQSFYPSVKETMLQGITMGFSFRYAEERHVGLVAELNLTQRGWKENFEEHPLEYQHRLTYIELPVMTHIFFGSRTVKGFINLGPQVGYMISDGIKANFNYTEAATLPSFPKNRRYEQLSLKIKNRFDYGITAGAGVEFVIRRRHSITLEGRYYYGLGNIFPSSRSDEFSSSHGSSILVTLGYLFRLK